MSWLYSQVLVAEFSAATCSDGAPSAQSSGNLIPQAYCAPDKMTAFSRLSRFGMTFAPLTESRGKELLMSYQADFPVKTSVSRGGGKGLDGERSGLWREMARIIGEVRPSYAFVENSPALTIRGLGTVLGDLAEMGFDAEWGVLSARDIGAIHLRERIWILAANNREERIQGQLKEQVFGKLGVSWCKDVRGVQDLRGRSDLPEPLVCRKSNGVPDYVDRISAIGNAQFPAVAATAFSLLHGRIKHD